MLVDGDVAMPPDNASVPTDVPLESQSPPFTPVSVGSQRKNSITPVGVGPGATAVSVAVSNTVDPGITSVAVVLDCVTNGAVWIAVAKHSSLASV